MKHLKQKHQPIPLVLVYLSGAGLVAAGISIIIKLYTKLATQLLALLLLLIILMLDLPGAAAGDQTAMSMMKRAISQRMPR